MDADALGRFLKDKRRGLDPSAFGIPAGRRRTPGLRREEVAQRAAISPVAEGDLMRIRRLVADSPSS